MIFEGSDIQTMRTDLILQKEYRVIIRNHVLRAAWPIFFIKLRMGSKFTILFTYMDFLFIGEISKRLMERVPVYHIIYALAANPEPIGELEIYRGSAPDHRICWRQRITQRETVVVDTDLIEVIGWAIKTQEDLQSS